jgi:hypothetical protein
MKRLQAVSLLVLGLLTIPGTRAAAEFKTAFQPGFNVSYEGGGNSFLWGTIGSFSLAPGDYSWNPYPPPKEERRAARSMNRSYPAEYAPSYPQEIPPGANAPPPPPAPPPPVAPESQAPPLAMKAPTTSTSYYPRQQTAPSYNYPGYNYPGYYYPGYNYPGYNYPGYYYPGYNYPTYNQNQKSWYGR